MSCTIYFKYGAMNSGKSLDLIKIAYNYEQRNISSLVLKPEIDTRMPGHVYSRAGLNIKAQEISCVDVESVKSMLNETINGHKVILIEEANFLTKEIVDVIVSFGYEHNLDAVLFFGLLSDFRGDLFEGSKRIIELADKIEESTSICWCGKKARKNVRLINGEITKIGPTILVDNDATKVEYTTLCNYHYYRNQLS